MSDATGLTDAWVVIVGGGPAGSACAAALVAAGREVLVLDAETFPTGKPCAGWITPAVLEMLGITPADYPHTLTVYDHLRIHLGPLDVPVRSRQYAVRRCEFDPWLRERSGAVVRHHRVRRIERLDPGRHHGLRFLIDGRWRCRWLVGAGGTACPVRREVFRHGVAGQAEDDSGGSRPEWIVGRNGGEGPLVACLEAEFRAAGGPRLRPGCMELWFRLPGLDGYGWLLPKNGGWLNVGLGGRAAALTGGRLQALWERFTARLVRDDVLCEPPPVPRGYAYRLQDGRQSSRHGNRRPWRLPLRDGAVLVGDAAGLATADLGEGIGPAIAAGQLAADLLLNNGSPSSRPAVPRWSLPGDDATAGRWLRRLLDR